MKKYGVFSSDIDQDIIVSQMQSVSITGISGTINDLNISLSTELLGA